MWPVLLDMSRDDCRRTLRRLELEAYSSMMSVFRAQGALADDRKKILEELRGALNISSDRHTAEARRASNDELLATIAERLSGPNTSMGWVSEGRRKVPILPRGTPQTIYTAIADLAAAEAAKQNDEIALKSAQQKLNPVSPKSLLDSPQDMELEEATAATAEAAAVTAEGKEGSYPPIVMWDQSLKVASEEAPPRKRSRIDAPHHNRSSHQRFLNISQIYSSFSKGSSGKSGQYGKNSYSQNEKKMSAKSNHPHLPKSSMTKHRSVHGKHGNKHSGQVAIPHHQVRSGIKSPTDPHIVGSQALQVQNPPDANTLKSQTSGFQANFAQSIAQSRLEDVEEGKQAHISANLMESPTMQLLTQVGVPPMVHEACGGLPAEDASPVPVPVCSANLPTYINPSSPSIAKGPHTVTGKPCHLIIKKSDTPGDKSSSKQKIHVSSVQILSKPTEVSGIKVLQNRQVVVTPNQNNSPKIMNTSGKLMTTKLVQQIPLSQSQMNLAVASKPHTPNAVMDKLVIVSKSPNTLQPSILQRSLSNASKNIIISSHSPLNPSKDSDMINLLAKNTDSEGSTTPTSKNADLKLPAKTFLVNSKSGQKMVVLPAKPRTKGSLIGQPMPVVQFKGIQGRPAMKLFPMGGQAGNPTKSGNITVVSKSLSKDIISQMKPNFTSENAMTKLTSNVQIAKGAGQAIIRPAGSKRNVFVVQKSLPQGKTGIAFTKNGNDLSKIVMSNTINPPKSEKSDAISLIQNVTEANAAKSTGDVIVLELRNEQGHAGSLPEFLQGGSSATPISGLKKHGLITEDTPILFQSQLTDESCNIDSMESTASDNLMDVDSLKTEDSFLKSHDSGNMSNKVAADDQLASDWDMESDLCNKRKSTKINDLGIDMGMSSDSDGDAYDSDKKDKADVPTHAGSAAADENNEMFAQRGSTGQASRTLLSQLQDEGSSSNDSPFVLNKKTVKNSSLLGKFKVQKKMNASLRKDEAKDGSAVGAARELASSQVCSGETQSQPSKSDIILSTAIASADINLDSFEYLEDGMSGEDMFHLAGAEPSKRSEGAAEPEESSPNKEAYTQNRTLEQELSEMLADDNMDAERMEALDSSQASAME